MTPISSETLNGDTFQVFKVCYETVRKARGFARDARGSRREYRINGLRVSQVVFSTLKRAAKAA
jgi:hypothetical protein